MSMIRKIEDISDVIEAYRLSSYTRECHYFSLDELKLLFYKF